MSTTLITSRDPKGLHITGLFETTFNKAKLDDGRAQRIIENGGEFQVGLKELIEKFSVSNQFADEEVESSYTYPQEYTGPKPIQEQITMLAKLFNLDPSHALEFVKNLAELPDGAEGYFAIPRWQKVSPTYGEALERVLKAIDSSRKFKNYRKGELGSKQLRQHARTIAMLDKLGETQTGDILIVPCQFGMKHRGRSVRRAREVFQANEFGLGAFAVGCMLLTHPVRAVRFEEVDMDCAGDEFSPDAGGQWSDAPVFEFYDGQLRFVARKVGNADGNYGSASGFLPQ